MGIVFRPMPIPPPLKTLREGEIPVRNTPENRNVQLQVMKQQIRQSELLLELLARPKYDSLAARVAAPIWLLVWVMTAGKMGKRS